MRMVMSVFVGWLLLVLLGTNTAYADQYMLVMSKDDRVCQHIYEIYFWDMRKHGKLVFENHEEYNWLKWDEDISVYSFYGNNEELAYAMGNTGKIAAFDINNDGEKETVLFERNNLSGSFHDVLSFFPLSYFTKFKTKINTKDYPLNYPRFPPNSYPLKELPVQMIFDDFGIKQEQRLSLGAWSYIRPLKIDTQYFISIFDSEWQGEPYPPLEKTNIVSISRYNPDNQIQDVCYFVRANLWEKGTYPWLKNQEDK